MRSTAALRIFGGWTLVLGAVATPARAAEIHVPGHARTVQAGITRAAQGDTVIVGPGVWLERIDLLGKRIRLVSRDGPEATALDAGGAGSVVTIRTGETRETVIEGFTLRGGTGTSILGVTYGGGVFLHASSATLRGNVVRDNRAERGAGIAAVLDASPRIEQNRILDNGSLVDDPVRTLRGGGIYCEGPIEIVGNRIEGNVSVHMGAGILTNFEAVAFVQGNEIRGNACRRQGGGIAVMGTRAWIERNEIHGNSAEFGGGINLTFAAPETVHLTQNRVTANTARVGGGIASRRGIRVTLDDDVVTDNTATQSGGGLFVDRATAVVRRARIERNEAPSGGGLHVCVPGEAVTIERSIVRWNRAAEGGGIRHLAGELAITSSLVAGNRAADGGGIDAVSDRLTLRGATLAGNEADGAGGGIRYRHGASSEIRNGVLHGNRAPVGAQIVAVVPPDVRSSLVEGGFPGERVLDADPLFVDPAAGNYRIRLGSPCVDAGDDGDPAAVGFDFEGDPRRADGDRDGRTAVDLGADELDPVAAARFGAVNAAAGALADVVLVNGSPGDARRRVVVRTYEPVRLEVLPAPAGPAPGPFVLYLWEETSDPYTLSPQPFGLGVMSFATPLAGDPLHRPSRIWNNLGFRRRLGHPTSPSRPAPFVAIDRPGGFPVRQRMTVQGFQSDHASIADGPLSITNAVVLEVTD